MELRKYSITKKIQRRISTQASTSFLCKIELLNNIYRFEISETSFVFFHEFALKTQYFSKIKPETHLYRRTILVPLQPTLRDSMGDHPDRS